MGITGYETEGFYVYFKNIGNGVILMEFDEKDTSTTLELEKQEKSERGNSAKISESQVTEN